MSSQDSAEGTTPCHDCHSFHLIGQGAVSCSQDMDSGTAAAAEDRVRLMKKVERLVNERRAAEERGEDKLKLLSVRQKSFMSFFY